MEALLSICKPEQREWRWAKAKVDPASDHFRLSFGNDEEPTTPIGPPAGNCFPVEFLVDPPAADSAKRQRAVRPELDLYLSCALDRIAHLLTAPEVDEILSPAGRGPAV